MSGSSHIQSVLIGVEYRNCRQTLDVYLLFAILLGQIKSKLNYRLTNWPFHKLQICKSVLIEFAPSKWQKVNKHLKLDNNYNIRRQSEHFKCEMNRTLNDSSRTLTSKV